MRKRAFFTLTVIRKKLMEDPEHADRRD